jgi:hypothetical protein
LTGAFQIFPYSLQYTVQILSNLIIPEPHYPILKRFQKLSSYAIQFLLLSVMPAIQFDNQAMLDRAKIGHLRAYGKLAPELHSQQLAITQFVPKFTLGIRQIAS